MKQSFLILFCIGLLIYSSVEGAKLKEGEEFYFRSSNIIEAKSVDPKVNIEIENEKFYRINWHFKVLESYPDSCLLQAIKSYIDEYSRQKQEGNWYSSPLWYSKELVNDSIPSSIKYSSKFNLQDTFRVRLSFTDNQVAVIRSNKLSENTLRDPLAKMETTEHYYKKVMTGYFFNLTRNISVNDTIYSFGRMFKVEKQDQQYIWLSEIVKTIVAQTKIKVHKATGLLAESFILNKNNTADPIEVERHTYFGHLDFNKNTYRYYSRNNIVKIDTSPFYCRYREYNITKDTVFNETNVTLICNIKNLPDSAMASIWWSQPVTWGWDKREISVKKMKDGTFKVRLKTDDLRQIDLGCGEKKIAFSILPGSDLFIEADYNQFVNTITAMGTGSNAVNYFIEQERLNLNQGPQSKTSWLKEYNLRYALNPKEFKAYYTNKLENLNQNINIRKDSIAPEIYLAEYWGNTLSIAEILTRYIDNNFIMNKKEVLDSVKSGGMVRAKYRSINRPIDVSDIVHPYNDMMSFSSRHGSFSYIFIGQRLEQIMDTRNKLYAYDNKNRHIVGYELTDMFYTGKTGYAVKYYLLSLAYQQEGFKTYKTLYESFIDEYPHSKLAMQLKKEYLKITSLHPNHLLPNFQLLDLEGNKVWLSDFEGRAVYLSIISDSNDLKDKQFDIENWANPFYNTMDKSKAEFIYLFLGDDIATIKELAHQIPIHGIILTADETIQQMVKQQLMFKKNPDYIILDTEGKIAYFNTPTPVGLTTYPHYLIDATKPMFPEDNSNNVIRTLQVISLVLLIGIFLAIAIILYIKRRSLQKQRMTELNTKVRELELTAIRAQMNPHFMYNCLNSIQNLVQKQKTDEAHLYISKFASFIRMILNNSNKEEIALAEELEMVQQYVELEQLRFPIHFSIDQDKTIDTFSLFIPPLLLQPLVENAIVHGLSSKENDRQLQIKIETKDKHIALSIIDNGIGINQEALLQNKSTGKGLSFTRERIELLTQKYGSKYQMHITNLIKDATNRGTCVEISFLEE